MPLTEMESGTLFARGPEGTSTSLETGPHSGLPTPALRQEIALTPRRQEQIQPLAVCGLTFSAGPPHVVISVGDLVDVNGCKQGEQEYENTEVMVGDRVLTVDEIAAGQVTTNDLYRMLTGTMYSIVKVGLARASDGEEYIVSLQRNERLQPVNNYNQRVQPAWKPEHTDLQRQVASIVENGLHPEGVVSLSPRLSKTAMLLQSANRVLERLQPKQVAEQNDGKRASQGEGKSTEVAMPSLVKVKPLSIEQDEESNATVARLQELLEEERERVKSLQQDGEELRGKYTMNVQDLQQRLDTTVKMLQSAELELASCHNREARALQDCAQAKTRAQEQEEFYSDLCAKLEEERDASELQLAREKEARIASDNARRKTELAMESMIKEMQQIKAAEHRRREMEEQLLLRFRDADAKIREAKSAEESLRKMSVDNAAMMMKWHQDFFAEETAETLPPVFSGDA